MTLPDLPTALLVCAIFLLAGGVKGVTGLGLPAVSLALLTITLGIRDAIALLLIPSLVTNIWQAVAGGAFRPLARQFAPLFAAVTVGIVIGTALLAAADTSLLTVVLGSVIAAYAGITLAAPPLPVPTGRWRLLAAPVGLANGIVTGMTGSAIVPAVLWFGALRLPKDRLVQTMGMLFALSTVVLGAAMAGRGLLSVDLGLLSLLAVVPAMLGMRVGQAIRDRLNEALFRRIFLLALLALGLYLVGRSLT